jgi:hypothetical protein
LSPVCSLLSAVCCRLPCFEHANSQVITTSTSAISCLLSAIYCLLSSVCCRLTCFEPANSQVITTRIRHKYVNRVPHVTDAHELCHKH